VSPESKISPRVCRYFRPYAPAPLKGAHRRPAIRRFCGDLWLNGNIALLFPNTHVTELNSGFGVHA